MPRRTLYRYTVRLTDGSRFASDLPGFLDMLRYDGARVVAWSGPTDQRVLHGHDVATFTVTLESEVFTPDRWASFGLTARETGRANA